MSFILKKNLTMNKIWRLHVTNACNANCFFCHNESICIIPNNTFIATEFLKSFIEKHIKTNDIVVITGGEPLLHPQIGEIVSMVRSKVNLNFHLNSNGILLHDKLEVLIKAGLENLHLNIASFNPIVYENIYGIKLSVALLNTIEHAKNKGLKIIINCVILKNINDDYASITNMIEYCKKMNLNLSFIEEHTENYCDISKGLDFQNKFEILLTKLNYKMVSIAIGRKIYRNCQNSIIIAAPCAPHFAWNSNEYADSYVLMENGQVKKFSSPEIIQISSVLLNY